MRSRVLEAPLGLWVDPRAAYVAMHAADEWSFWLDCGTDASTGVSAMGRASAVLSDRVGGSVLESLRTELAAHRDTEVGHSAGFRLGWVGWLSYELRSHTMEEQHGRVDMHPHSLMLRVDRAVVFDHSARTVTLLALGERWEGDAAVWRAETVRALLDASRATPSDISHHPGRGSVEWAHDDERYLEMIAECQRAIVAGDAYQLCLTTSARVTVRPDPLAAYLALRRTSPAHHGGLLRAGGISLLSASPEQFLAVDPDGGVQTRPIKGTRPRGATPHADSDLVRALRESDKERAENLMIVDLMRNDLSRVCQIGSVHVPELFAVETYPHVHQLVSTVRGRLREGLGAIDAVEACFPAGSMTGAPKREATRILDSLEGRPRGIYSGAWGHLGFDGRLDLAMVIRTIVVDEAGATVGSGGGITALSIPEEELAEVKLKAAALLAVLVGDEGVDNGAATPSITPHRVSA